MTKPLSQRSAAIILATCILVGGCGDSSAPDRTSVAGRYAATAFTSTAAGATTDHLAAGASITLVLTAQGTTSGSLFIPGGNEDGTDFAAGLTGTWTLSGNTVQLSHSADTFLRDMPLTVQGNALVGDQAFGDTRVQVRLTKQSGVSPS